MWKHLFSMVWSIICIVLVPVSIGSSIEERVESMLSSMSLNDMLGQMTQLDISTILNHDRTLNLEIVHIHAQLKIGSYLNTPSFEENNGIQDYDAGILPRNTTVQGTTFSASEWRNLLTQIQHIFMNESNGHPVLYGLDSVHGANYVRHATIFSQQINAAATFHPSLVYEMGRITSRDTAAAGIPWIFGPILEIAQNPLWSRTFETFGEDPFLVSTMAHAIIRGIQSTNQTTACMKHVIGYSKTPTGHDRDGVTVSDYDLLNYFAPPFLSAIQAGAKTAMASYVSVNGVPVVANTKILRDLLRHDMNFNGLIVTDWAEIENLHVYHHVATSASDAVRMALTQTSLDLSMVPLNTSFIDMARIAVNQNPVLNDRIRDSVRRILRLKLELGLYEKPVPGEENVQHVGNPEDREIALTIARESIILLQNNESILPLPRKQPSSTVFLTGPSMDNIGHLCGGWTLKWQGISGNSHFPNGISIKRGMEQVTQSTLPYYNGLYVNGSYSHSDLEKAKQMARNSSYTIIALGEGPYAEKPGDINDLALPQGQIEYVREIASTSTKVIVVLVSGRPRLLGDLPRLAHAILYTMLPGEMGGQAVAEILYGMVNPSGRLPITYPRDAANIAIPYNHRVTTQCGEHGACPVQWSFGSGLSYTTFAYRNLTLNKTTVNDGQNETIEVSVTVENTGSMDGMETVMLFLTQVYRESSVPEVKQLKKFKKIYLHVGKSQVVTFTLSMEDWSVYEPHIGLGFTRVVQPGKFIIAIKPETTCDRTGQDSMCATFVVART